MANAGSKREFSQSIDDTTEDHNPLKRLRTTHSQKVRPRPQPLEDVSLAPHNSVKDLLLQKLRDRDKEIQELRSENTRLRLGAIPSAPEKPWHVLHRVRCPTNDEVTTFYDEPIFAYDKATRHHHWNGCRRIPSESHFEGQNASESFVVYQDYSCADRPSRHSHRKGPLLDEHVDGDEEDDEVNGGKKAMHSGESVKVLSPEIQEFLDNIFSMVDGLGYYKAARNPEGNTFESPYYFFYHFEQNIMAQAEDEYADHPQTMLFLQYLGESISATVIETQDAFGEKKCVNAALLPYLFRPGDLIYIVGEGQPVAKRQESVLHRRDSGNSTTATFYCNTSEINFDGNFRRETSQTSTHITIPADDDDWIFIQSLDARPIAHIDEQQRRELLERGRTFFDCRDQRYVTYAGNATYLGHSMMDARFMIDTRAYNLMHKEDTTPVVVGPVVGDEEIQDGSNEDFLAQLPAWIHGYNLTNKEWVHLLVRDIRPVIWHTDSFDNLVIPSDTKELIEGLVKHKIESDLGLDFVRGKGTGLIILLHGGPGTGKSLTAESVAEIAKKPLYRITCGDIGTDAVEIEKYLESAFSLGRRWDCVVLLDEADVYMEQRSVNMLQRNAVVSVFLRAMEYFDGILILTSKSLAILDETFKSRIQLVVHYPPLDPIQRLKIWGNFITRLEVLGESMDVDNIRENLRRLADFEMNGREIRSTITTARQLARFRGKVLAADDFSHVISISQRSDENIRQGMFMDAGADIDTQRRTYDNTLQAAVKGARLDTVKTSPVAEADVVAAAARYSGRTTLQASLEGNHDRLVHAPTEEGEDFKALEPEDGSTLLAASLEARPSIVSDAADLRRSIFEVTPGLLGDLVKRKSIGRNEAYVCSLAWELKACVALDLDDVSSLQDVLTITGEVSGAAANRCRDWVHETWGDVGILVLDATCEAITHGQFLSEFLTIRLQGVAGVDERAEVAILHKDIDTLIAVVETLAWLAATFRPPIEDCISYSSATATLIDKGIQISLRKLVEAEQIPSKCCWHPVVGSAIIARGFCRASTGDGLQLPFLLMLELTGMIFGTDISRVLKDELTVEHESTAVSLITQEPAGDNSAKCEGPPADTERSGIFFTGVHSVLYPIERDNVRKTIKWHYATSNSVMTPPQGEFWLRLHETDLGGMSHVLGYTPEVKVLLGTKDRLQRESTMQSSSADKEKTTWSFDWDGITMQAGFSGSGLSLPFKVNRRKGQKAAPTAKPSYDQIIHHTVREPVILFESAHDQEAAWLVPKLSLILDLALFHAARMGWLEKLSDASRTALFAEPHWNGGLAAQRILDDYERANTTFALSSDHGSPIALKDLVKDIFAAMTTRTQLDQLYPSSRPALSVPLLGWDLLELTNPVTTSRRLQVDVQKDGRNNSTPTWLQFASQVPVFFCDNIGKIMESALPACPSSQQNKKYLIANLHILGGLMTSCKTCRGYHVGTDKKWIWKVPQEACFAPCDHDLTRTKRKNGSCFKDRMQLMLSENHDCVAQEVTDLVPERGAVVFGSKTLRARRLNSV